VSHDAWMGSSATMWPLIGREVELDVVLSTYGRMAQGAPVGGVLLVGEAGVGKTRLAREAVGRLAAPGRRTFWTTATKSAATVPLGALAPLLTVRAHPGTGLVDTLASLVARFADESGQPCVVAVDDAHLLDETSAAVIHQLATQRCAFVLLTTRPDAPTPDAVTSLWSAEGVMRVDLRALADDSVSALLGRVLGRLDPVSERRIQRICAGNPLLLRELLYAGAASGALAKTGGGWRWTGTKYATGRLIDIVETRMGALDPEQYAAVLPLAYAESLALPLLEAVVGRDRLLAAERRGLITIDTSGARFVARLAHPLYAEVIRGRTPRYQEREVWRTIADALASTPLRRSDDAFQLARWRLNAGHAVAPGLLVAASDRARARADLDAAEEFALAARRAGGGWTADLALADALISQGRSTEADNVLPELPADAAPDERARWQVAHEWTRSQVIGGDPSGPGDAAQAGVLDPAAEAARSWRLLFAGSCRGALQLGESTLGVRCLPADAANWATAAVVASAGLLGRGDRAMTALREGLAAADQATGTHVWGRTQIGVAGCVAMLAGGDLTAAAGLADRFYREAVDRADGGVPGSTFIVGVWAAQRAMVARHQGKAQAAVAAMTEAAYLLEELPAFVLTPVYVAELAGAYALLGDPEAARISLRRVDDLADIQQRLFCPWIERNRGWVAAASGDLAAAAAHAKLAADLAETTEQPTIAALALFDAARFGDAAAVSGRLNSLALRIGHDTPITLARVAAALVAHDAPVLAEAARSLAATGHLLYAAEAATCAHREHVRAGRTLKARTVAHQAVMLSQACEHARTPLLNSAAFLDLLTPRERHIASLAAAGSSSPEIATGLGISVRTVDNHLARTYAKLGINSRTQLARALTRRGAL
jgi:DNA-binding NarL/FixJ family response regulator